MPVYLGDKKVSIFAGAGAAKMQEKTVTPTENQQAVTPDTGYDGLTKVTVGAVSSTYIGSKVTKKSAQTYTPGTSYQTIGSGQYLSGTQTIKGDSNLVGSNILSGKSIFGVPGSVVVQKYYTGSSTPSSSLGNNGDLYLQTGGYCMASVTLTPTGYDGQRSSYISVDASYPLSNGLTSSSSDTFTVLNLNKGGGAVSKLAVKFDMSAIPTDAKVNSISCKIKARISNASPYILSGVAQLYCGTAGLSGEIELGTSPVAQTFNDTGWWDRESLDDLILLITCTRGSLSANNNHTLRFYGADLTVDYTGGSTGPTEQLMLKQNGVWGAVSKVYKKVNGLWVEQSDLAGLFDTQTNYVKG